MIQKLFILNGQSQNAAHRANVGTKSRRNRRRGERCFLSSNLGGCKGGATKPFRFETIQYANKKRDCWSLCGGNSARPFPKFLN